MNITKAASTRLVAKWFELVQRLNRLSYECAKYMYAIWDLAQGNEALFKQFVRAQLQETKDHAILDLKLARAYEVARDPDLWLRLGSSGVILMVYDVAEDRRRAFVFDARGRARKHGALGAEQIVSLREKYAVRRQRAQDDRVHPATKASVFEGDLRRLIQRYPALAKELSPEARSYLGLSELPQRRGRVAIA